MTFLFHRIQSILGGARRAIFDGRAPRRAYSLLEVLVVCAIIGVIAAIVATAASSIRQTSRMAQCMAHLRQINQAVILYRAENQAFPLVPEGKTLQDILRPWVGDAPDLFHCPEDSSGQTDSYTYFYVPRTLMTEADRYLLGCSRHQKYSQGVVVHTGNYTDISENAPIVFDDGHNTVPILPGDDRDYGTLRFADGSTVSVSMGQSDHAEASKGNPDNPGNAPDRPTVGVMFSLRDKSGHYYSMVRMKDGALGTVSFSITPGHRFEVATPAAIIAVRGTQFSVTTLRSCGKPATQVTITSGVVDMDPVSRGKSIRLTPTPGKNRGYAVQGESPVYN